ncbi:hypothetical protein LX15_003149 [Streptoalloteichus tenebrarius]|uniref:DUF190 domain-containing protein n=1 Tax=Streptoalloteichus tenebrarius (strain ATCC 17920 / DSM 40477 / JCM 4838 / CBS 697.72 / NBRC 16177 / NCIMB 11028 / NRRL B-12390 / A12253. 1 / ISP 5477) TaxID=1933 RepID=A0ABT1HVB7_STRSD|nr:DUF190 domain-containing protein [Streptoalloteichus tenebrarius]MCP2259448.1 hypothetical protein [Streptoalloteichus tenebrarius]BFF02390.1 DUF190 domain-containing protein [Streptoalloteichus tenebrarius]
MRWAGAALRMTVFVCEDDTWEHRPLHHEIVRRAHEAGLAGVSVFRGVEGYGSSDQVHTTRLLSLASDLPVMVVLVDTPERVRGFLPQVEELLGEGGLVTLDDVEAFRFTKELE